MCCSLYDKTSANVDIDYAEKRASHISGVRDYGDEGLVELIVAELIRLLKGIGSLQWRSELVELQGRKVGIIGMGTTGRMLVDRLQDFGTQISYFNRSRKTEMEKKDIVYLTLPEPLSISKIISLYLPKHAKVLQENKFSALGNKKVPINTFLGLSFDKPKIEN